MKISEIKVSYSTPQEEKVVIKRSRDAFDCFWNAWNKDEIELRESFAILLLNRANKVNGAYHMSSGGCTGTVVDAKMVFAVALKTMAHSIILCHNHPSGSLKPSSADIEITKKIKEGGKLLEIKVLDHLIITPAAEYFSFGDDGIM